MVCFLLITFYLRISAFSQYACVNDSWFKTSCNVDKELCELAKTILSQLLHLRKFGILRFITMRDKNFGGGSTTMMKIYINIGICWEFKKLYLMNHKKTKEKKNIPVTKSILQQQKESYPARHWPSWTSSATGTASRTTCCTRARR